jgi:hypothetical protein
VRISNLQGWTVISGSDANQEFLGAAIPWTYGTNRTYVESN